MFKEKAIPLSALVVTLLFGIMSTTALTAFACTKSDFDNALGTPGQSISINPDGSVTPIAAPIRYDGWKYVFTDNVYCPVVVYRDDVTIDGAGFVLQGPFNGTQTDLWILGLGSNEPSSEGTKIPWSVGIDLPSGCSNLTVENLNIRNFSIGLFFWTPNNRIIGNGITQNLVGVLLAGSNSTFARNYVGNNQYGVFFGANDEEVIPSQVQLVENAFVNNTRNLSGCVCVDFNSTEATHTWDNGEIGNYWSDYNGTDTNKDGIGDIPYVIDVLNQDRFPLVQNSVTPPAATLRIPFELVIPIGVLSIILVSAYAARRKRSLRTS